MGRAKPARSRCCSSLRNSVSTCGSGGRRRCTRGALPDLQAKGTTMAYRSLMSRYKDQPRQEIFAHFGYQGHEGETWETPYEKLASLAKKEDWDFHRSEFKRPGQRFPILFGYLNYTFLRIQEQDRLVYSSDKDRACFNTG